MYKKIIIKNPKSITTADSWVSNRDKMKKIGLYIPLSLHVQLKTFSAQTGDTMSEIILKSIEEKIKR